VSQPAPQRPTENSADVVVVGAGPAGSALSAHLAQAGLDVVLLEQQHHPRPKVCGDALGPRAVRELVTLGLPTPESDGWHRTKGVRLVGGGMRLQLDWPDTAGFPPYGLVRRRDHLDAALAQHASARGAQLRQGVRVTAPLEESGRVVGVVADQLDESGAVADRLTFRAPLVVAADGGASPLATAAGRAPRAGRAHGRAVRAYFAGPRHDDDYLETWLDLGATGTDGREVVLPGYGWIFGLGDGTSNVGIGVLGRGASAGAVDEQRVLRDWTAAMPPEWSFDQESQVGEVEGGPLALGLDRRPAYADGLMLVGDAGGMGSPFNGEGIAYALESARLAAEIAVQAFARPDDAGRERVLAGYPAAITDSLGGYYTLGRVFAKMIGNPQVMRWGVRYGLPRRTTMGFLLKVIANVGEIHGGGTSDRVLATLARVTPAA
jgi:geranylgeranyl reductase family protein